jgi:hypothetical protein
LQHFLLTGHSPPELVDAFRQLAQTLSFTTQLYVWRDSQWVPFPPQGLRILLLEELHVQNAHIGSQKLFHLLQGRYYWPSMMADCKQYTARCFECQVSGGKSHGSWQGKILDLPAGPRLVWALDLIENVGPPKAPKQHILVAVCCFSKFCVLCVLKDKSSASVHDAIKHRIVA